jgi:hypothetical protein
MVDIVSREAVGASIDLIKFGKQEWELKRRFKISERRSRQAYFKVHISEHLELTDI